MTSTCAHVEDLGKLIKILHPNLVSNIERCKVGEYNLFPSYHGCSYRNRSRTRKKIQYNRGEQCIKFCSQFLLEKIQKEITESKSL